MKQRKHLLFAYGTLLDPHVQQVLFSRTLPPGTPALLHNWKKYTHKQYPYIIPSSVACVTGSVIELSAKEMAAADLWEEVPTEYQREWVEVICQQTPLKVWAYTRRKEANNLLG